MDMAGEQLPCTFEHALDKLNNIKFVNKALLCQNPQCDKYLTPPISQCVQGHSICSTCIKENYCPLCKSTVINTHNIVLDTLANGILLRQKNVDGDKEDQSSMFVSIGCPLCTWTGVTVDVFKHIVISHPEEVCLGPNMPFNIHSGELPRCDYKKILLYHGHIFVSRLLYQQDENELCGAVKMLEKTESFRNVHKAMKHVVTSQAVQSVNPGAVLIVRVAPTARQVRKARYRELMIKVGPETTGSTASAGSFHSAISSVLVAAQCFALMPVQGISSSDTSQLKFQWCSLRVLYTCFTICGALLTTVICCIQLAKTGITFNNSLFAVFSASTLMTLLLFLQLATYWPQLVCRWEEVEKALSIRYGMPNLKTRFSLVTAIVLLLALVEHILANTRAIEKSLHCSCGEPLDVIRAFFIYNYHFVFLHVGYAHWKGFLLIVMNIIKTFSWSYMDLFIMLVSIALADRYQALNRRLRSITGQVLPAAFWRTAHEDYNRLVNLTRMVDSCLSKIVLLSFSSNLYFICFQLLNSMRPLRDFTEAMYFYWSIIYLLLKTCAVSLCAAGIHDYSSEPKNILYAVPSEGYCTEVQRFLMQLTTDEVALTGLNFFSVTRAFMMTVAGTIVTYEVVLLQFNMAADVAPSAIAGLNNDKEECLWLSDIHY